MSVILKTEKLRVEFTSHEFRQATKVALGSLDLEVNTGEVFGFLGPNGAGKTTTMNVLLGFVPPTSGAAYLFGIDVRQPIARQRIGYLPEMTYYYKFLTAEELLRFYAKIFGLSRTEADQRIDQLLKLVELEPARKRPIKSYSKGMQQRVGLAQALINNPDLLILDEPTSGLDPLGRMKVREIIQRLKNEGKTVFFSSHELGEVETVCDRVAIINQGELKAVGTRQRSRGATPGQSGKGFSGHRRLSNTIRVMNTIWALAGVVIKELYRRKDFYVLFVLTALITLAAGMVNFFHDHKIVRYVKDICLLLIWVSALVIAIVTTARQIPAERESRTIFPLLAKPVTRWQVIAREISRLLAGHRHGAGGFLYFLCHHHRFAGASLAVAVLFPGRLAAMGHARHRHRHGAAAARLFRRAVVHHHDLFHRRRRHFAGGRHLNIALQQPEPMQTIFYTIYFLIPHLEWFDLRDRVVYDWGRVTGWIAGWRRFTRRLGPDCSCCSPGSASGAKT